MDCTLSTCFFASHTMHHCESYLHMQLSAEPQQAGFHPCQILVCWKLFSKWLAWKLSDLFSLPLDQLVLHNTPHSYPSCLENVLCFATEENKQTWSWILGGRDVLFPIVSGAKLQMVEVFSKVPAGACRWIACALGCLRLPLLKNSGCREN